MKINLRKASVLQNNLNDFVKQSLPKANVEINQFEDINLQLETAETLFEGNMQKAFKFTDILYDIRKKVSLANQNAGINDVLANIANLEKKINVLNQVIHSGERLSSEVLSGKIEKIKLKDDSSSYYHTGDEISTSIISKEKMVELKEELKSLKKQKQTFQDKLLELNVSSTIELSDDSISILEQESLI
jgi:hypothetical protein